ncbi:S8/S53 family peptidase [Hydrogenobacter hydrogenophilus]|uniref:Peptidase S8/S53 domain-containing protein n=1 Tax=Hydrogenobacter hydrogenophilus TaxID=35835 RepID=A0A285P434_9AQUI|nr:S8/S53 family peptidase [Hydrogenobacter hydrogenophilus]SNZ16499.1 hypothetical protein SAMN06265353_1615 [Hydrogenobacter hydrogenophilus]
MGRKILALLVAFSILHAQTIVVPIPGEPKPQPQPPQGGGSSGLGAVLVGLVGASLLLFITKAVFSKPSKPPRMAFVPFEFIALHTAKLPPDLQVIDREVFEGYTLSLIRWEEESQKLEEKLKDRVLILEPNYLYELYGDVSEAFGSSTKQEASLSVVAVLDTGADESKLQDAVFFVKNLRKDNYKAEKHGTAVAFLVHKQKGAKVALYRVCSENVCDGWSISKALLDVFRRGIRVVNMSFGTDREDRIVAFIIKGMSLKGFVFVAPVGNVPSEELPFPARLEEVLSVAGKPCFPERICRKAKAMEEYKDIHTPVGKVVGTSFSSAIYAGKLVSP